MAYLSSTSHHTKNCIDDWIASKDKAFFRRGIHMLERWEKVVAMAITLNKTLCIVLSQ